MADAQAVLTRLAGMGCEADRQGMARFGITAERAYGIRVPALRKLARELRQNHPLALALWASGRHEARILASMLADPARTDEALAEAWVADFDSWDLCDQCCMNLFWRAPWAWAKAGEWPGREAEFTRRAGFALMAVLAWKDKAADDDRYAPFFGIIERQAGDGRTYVKKAANWALRQMGKRNPALRLRAVDCARRIADQGSTAARWVAADALRELESEAVRRRMGLAEG